MMEVFSYPVGPVQANCYIVKKEDQILVIDPGAEGEKLIGIIEGLKGKVDGILLTHAHFDHIGAVDTLMDHFHCPLYLNAGELDFLEDPKKNSSASFMGIPPVSIKSKALPFKEGEQNIGDFTVNVWSAPGHSAGSSIIQIGDCLFTGDVLFQNSIGRTDLPSGNAAQMKESLKYLSSLNKDYEVYPGHGPATTLNFEKTHNPYFLYPGLLS